MPTLSDVNLVPGTGTARDLLLTSNGDLAFEAGDLVLVRGTQADTQEIGIRLRFFLGEWFLDILAGIPYLEQVLTKPPDLPRASNVLAQAIAESHGVVRVESVAPVFRGDSRSLSAEYTAVLESGETIIGTVEV